MREDDIISKYKQDTLNSEERPPDHIWENIRSQNEIDDVWERIVIVLRRWDRLIFWRRVGVSGALLLLLLGGTVGLWVQLEDMDSNALSTLPPVQSKLLEKKGGNQPEPHKYNFKKDNRGLFNPAPLYNELSANSSGSIDGLSENNFKSTPEGVFIESIGMAGNASFETEGASTSNSKFESTFLGVTGGPGFQSSSSESMLVYDQTEEHKTVTSGVFSTSGLVQEGKTNASLIIARTDSIIEADMTDEELEFTEEVVTAKEENDSVIKSRKYYVGVIFQAQNQWLLNTQTYEGMRRNELNRTLADFGKNIGIVAGVSLSPRITLQNELYLHAESGEKYDLFDEGVVNRLHYDLNYIKNQVTIKYIKENSLFGIPAHSSLLLGIYGGYLKSAWLKYDDQKQNISTNYKAYDFGVSGGYEVEFVLSERLACNLGIRSNLGLLDIIEPREEIIASLNRTRNFMVGLSLGVNYYFSL